MNDFIVAIELGSSRISGIAGRKADGTMHILAYAEEKVKDCVKRGVVYNIEKTYQSVNSVIAKLESVLKNKITCAYVGIGGQSVRSYKCVLKRNMLAHSYITNEIIDSIRQDSYDIPFSDCELLENFPQEYVIDSSTIVDPVGVMGTNVEGEFLNVIAKKKLKENIETVFANTNVKPILDFISPLQLADNVLTDAEKRSGCALVDLGADTTTLVVYKNNIVRYLVTLPIGSNNINKDLITIPIDEAETEDVKLKYGDACIQDSDSEAQDADYTTTDGRTIKVMEIQNYIEARVGEIIENVKSQIVNSNYSDKLLAGIVLTGGGSNMKNIVKAFVNSTKIDKIRIAKKVNQAVVKTSNASNITLDNGQTNTIVSLLLGGTISCSGDAFDSTNMFDQQQKEEERAKRQKEADEAAIKEAELATSFDTIKANLRDACNKVEQQIAELEKNGKDKNVRKASQAMGETIIEETINDQYDAIVEALTGKDKFKQSLKEGANLKDLLEARVETLLAKTKRAKKENSFIGIITKTVNDIVNGD